MDVRRRTGASIQVQTGSKRICQERLSCESATAEFECRECGTRQCGVCEEKLHSASIKLGSHSRTKIEPVSYVDGVRLCGMWCFPYNSAEFSCIECKTLFCPECNRAFHRGKLSKHHRARLPRPSKPSSETLESETPAEGAGINGLSSILSESPDLDPFLDALPPPLTVLPPSHPNLDRICTEIKEKHSFEDSEEDFISLETNNGSRQPILLESDSVLPEVAQKSELNQSQEEFLSLESNAKNSLDFLSGHFGGVGLQPKTDINNQVSEELSPFGDTEKSPQILSETNVLDKSLPEIEDPIMEFTMSRGMQASSNSDIGQLIIPDEYPRMDRGTGFAEKTSTGVSPSTEESLLVLQNVSRYLNTTPPSSLDSDPGRSRRKKEAVVRGMPRSPTSSMTEEIEALKDVSLHPLSKYKQGFLLVNENEELQVKSSEELLQKLGCPEKCLVKVVSIFGNTGDGKSYTLNHSFFGGQEVFCTSDTQQSCTIGVWAAYHRETNVVAIDTEGLLGTSSNENRRMRLLLKILAISDVVIYRTRAERLGRDMFQFLGDASKAFVKHFSRELEAAMTKIGMKSGGLSSLGPAVVVFHETQHTKPLGEEGDTQPADTLLQKQFEDMGSSMTAFRSLQYIGIQTVQPPTSFEKITSAILKHIQDTAVRSPRSPNVVYQALKVLNNRFSGTITANLPPTFPDEYFTCPERCLSCDARCVHTMNHTEKQHHRADSMCKYQHQFDNRVFLCMACSDKDGKKREVVPKTCSSNDSSWLGLMKYAWSGYVLECPKCGIIYRSRERWYGNEEPNVSAVRTEIRHIWTGDNIALQGTHNAARKLVDGISTVVDTISSVSAKPTKVMSQWMSDQIAPPYWRPNAEIVLCKICRMNFAEHEEPIHHCRACGEGICDNCSQNKMPVPERGWGETPVRVCDHCYKKKQESNESMNGNVSPDEQPVTARMVGEVMHTTISTLGSAVSYPLGYMVDVARPAYWIPDHEITDCVCCKEKFGPKLRIHHCRLCGKGVCDNCSQKRRPVPSRGWDTPVRVCDICGKREDPL